MINYSIHTLELQATINYQNFNRLTAALKKLSPSIQAGWYSQPMENHCAKISYTYRNLPYYGINSITLTVIRTKTHILRCLVYIEINPYNALSQCKYPNPYIIDAKKITEALEPAYKNLSHILNPPLLSSLTLNRVDFCTNLIFPAQIQAEEYIKLLKCSIPPQTLSEAKHFNPKQHRYTGYKESLLLICNSYSFQAYSKYLQMKQKNWNGYESAHGVVRLELRASKSKLEQLAQKYNIISPRTDYMRFLVNSPAIARQEIPTFISKMTGSGNFHRYEYIKSKIINSDYKTRDIEQMLDILFYLSRHSTSQNMLATLQMSQKKWQKYLKKFDKIETSPIPVPRTYKIPVYPGVCNWDTFF